MSYNKLPLKERLLSKAVPDGDCLMWIGATHPRGYGQIRVNGKFQKAYRVSYEIHHGAIPAGLVVMHSCDRPGCIKPEHLSVGTQADNVRDMFNKGRANKATGANNAKTKLTAAQVAEARALYIPKKYGHGAAVLGKKFGVSKMAMQEVLAGRTHKP